MSTSHRPESIIQMLRAGAAATPSAPAVVGLDGSTLLTYSDLLARVLTLAFELRDAGVEPTDVVLVTMPSGPDMLISVLAADPTAPTTIRSQRRQNQFQSRVKRIFP